MTNSVISLEINPEIAPVLFGQLNQNLQQIAEELEVNMSARGNTVYISGDEERVAQSLTVMENLRDQVTQGIIPGPQEIAFALKLVRDGKDLNQEEADLTADVISVTSRGKRIFPRNLGQKKYINAIRKNLLTFGIGPAGTGKTYLAIAMAVAALQSKEVDRIILTRPAVEAGEKLGFLPGDLQEKVDPYLRPLNDALFDILGGELYQRYMEKRIIEIAPLAYMRGRTLDNSFIILDEAQNTTPEQMKMFLTRMGFGSKVVVNGDATQVDLPRGIPSGLTDVGLIFQGVSGIAVVTFSNKDVVRHELVQRIIRAYEEYESPMIDDEQIGE